MSYSPYIGVFQTGDRPLSVSRLIEEIDFPSEREWCDIEAKQVEVSERFISALTKLTGVSSVWLKHGTSTKYPTELIYDHQSTKIESIASEFPLRSYVAIEPEAMDVILIVQFSEYRWQVFSFGFSMNFWDWVGDEHHISTIFELLKTTDRLLRHPYGRVISKDVSMELKNGGKHPSALFKMTGENSYWFEDLFDLYHIHSIAKDKYSYNGEWFIRLQDEFRRYVKSERATSQRDEDDV